MKWDWRLQSAHLITDEKRVFIHNTDTRCTRKEVLGLPEADEPNDSPPLAKAEGASDLAGVLVCPLHP